MRESGHVTAVINLMKGKWSYYGGGQFNVWGMVMLRRLVL